VARDPARLACQAAQGLTARTHGEGLKPSAETLAKVIELRKESRGAARKKKRPSDDEPGGAALKLPAVYRPVYMDEAYARFSHSIATERPFLERLTQFWTNHFAVSIDKIVVLGLAGAMEREAIRPRVTGHFTDLLLAVEKHPGDAAVSRQSGLHRSELQGRRGSSAGVATGARRVSTKIWRAKSSSCTRWVWMAATHNLMCQLLRRPSPAGRSGARTTARLARLGIDNGTPGEFHFPRGLPRARNQAVVRQELFRRRPSPGRGDPARPRAAPRDRAACFHQARPPFHRGRSAARGGSSE
jgi:hypothetical protein